MLRKCCQCSHLRSSQTSVSVAGVELHTEYIPIGSMYGIYANIGGILMVNVTIYIAYMDPMGLRIQTIHTPGDIFKQKKRPGSLWLC